MLIQAKGFCKREINGWEARKGLQGGAATERVPLSLARSPEPSPESVIELSLSYFADDA